MTALTDTPYDALIIGGGLSGLTAGFLLKNRKILILEKEERPGGRVLTRSRHGVHYDLGAVFAYPAAVLPFAMKPSPLLDSAGPIGIYQGGELHLGERISQCLKSTAQNAWDMDTLRAFHRDPERNASSLPEHLHAVLNAFFQVIHPGVMDEYVPERQLDAFITHDTRSHETGNDELITAYLSRLKNRVCCHAKVLSVRERENSVAVRFLEQGLEKTLLTRTVLLTTPAPVTLNLLDTMTDRSRSYLESLDYREGTVVALGLKNADLPAFSYIVTPTLPMNSVLQQQTSDPEIRILLVYYAGEKSTALHGQSPSAVVQKTLNALNPLEIGESLTQHLLFSDVHHWPMVGPVISPLCRKKWNRDASRPSERVFLAGEHMYWEPRNPMPYGMASAVFSGKQAAQAMERFFLQEPFRNTFLVRTSRYLMSETGPLYRGAREECNIALYGLILQARHDENLKNYLLDSRKDHLWEWQTGFGVTAEDSALVLEGLLESHVDPEFLNTSLTRLKERFFSTHHGAFQTILNGRADYWKGPSLDATAHLGYLMHEIAPRRFQEEILQCVRFVLAHQNPRGYWQGKWFPSRFITTRHAVRLCTLFPDLCSKAIQKSTRFVMETQNSDGGWNDSVIDTANALLTLKVAGVARDRQIRGSQWLRAREKSPGWVGEPVLYYWVELPTGTRLFYHCLDKGAVTGAWALLALKSEDGK